MQQSKEWMGYFLLSIVGLLWGINFGVVKSAYQDFHPIFFAALRFTVSGGLMLLIVLFREKDLKIRKQDFGRVAFVAVLGMAMYQIFWSLGLDRTTATNSALILSIQPLMGAVYMDVTKREFVRKHQYWGMSLALLGVALVILKPSAQLRFSLDTWVGDILTLFAGGCFTIFFSAHAKPLLQIYSPLRLMGYSMSISSAVLWIVVLFLAPDKPLGQVTLHSWYSFGYAVFFSGILAYLFWYEGLARIGLTKTLISIYLIPIWAVLFNTFFLGEKILPQQLIGGGLILWGVRKVFRS